jgi:hypothetical protein
MAVDVTGREIKIGQRIAYPVRKRSDMWLSTARVESIAEGAGGYTLHCRNPEGRSLRITALERVVIVPEGTPR